MTYGKAIASSIVFARLVVATGVLTTKQTPPSILAVQPSGVVQAGFTYPDLPNPVLTADILTDVAINIRR